MHRVARAGLVLALTAAASLASGCSWSVPWTWKRTTDPSGSCQVATPRDWQLGREFFLQRDSAATGPVAHGPRRLPPHGFALWGIDPANQQQLAQLPTGKRFQIRTALVRGEAVCSVWRVKETADFTADEKSAMEEVGTTLRWVR